MKNLFKKTSNFWPAFAPRDWAIVAAGITAFVAITAATVTKFSIWFDEAFGSYLIRFNFLEVTRYTAYDVHPPFYYWVLKLWTTVFGNTELGLRSMSIFFGAITIAILFGLVFRLFGRKAAVVTLVFLVLSPLFIRYSQEARMYTLLTAIIAAATYVLVYAQSSKKRWPWMVYGVLIAIGMLTQYFAALAWIAHWVWRAITLKTRPGDFKRDFFTKNWVVAHIVGVGIFAAWLPWLIRQFADVQGNGFWIPAITSATIPDFLTSVLLFVDHEKAQSWLAVGVYAVVLTTTIIIIRLLRTLKGDIYNNYLLVICMAIVPIVVLVTMSLPPLRPAFVDRYLMSTIVFLPVLIGVSVALTDAKKWRLVIGLFGIVVIIMMGLGIYNQSVIGNYNKSTKQSNDVRQLVEKVRAHGPGDAPIVASTPWIFYESIIYANNKSPIYFVDETTKYEFGSLRMLKENDDLKIKNLDEFTRKHSTFWVIANIKGGELNKMRDYWKITDTITINDRMSGQPLFQAARISVE